MLAAVICLSALCALLFLRVYALERGLRQGAEQLKERQPEGSPSPLRLAAPNRAMEELLGQINLLLRDMEEERSVFREREQAIRRQIANVSHDLRTPLTSILGYLQLLEQENVTEEERKSYLAVIESRARVLQDLIAGFYDLSRLEAGEYPVTREQVDLREVIGALLASFYDELEAQFRVEVDLPEDLPAVWGDRAAMERVYTNLIRNALEHGSGTLRVSVRQAGERVETCFANGGGDLKQEDLPKVFDRFFTSDQTRSGRNTGLGLAIVRALAGQMEGTARAELDGDTFSIILSWKA